jgi:hypothetical protein
LGEAAAAADDDDLIIMDEDFTYQLEQFISAFQDAEYDNADQFINFFQSMEYDNIDVGVLPPSPPRDTPEVVSYRWGASRIRKSKVQGTQSLDSSGRRERNTLRSVWWFVLPQVCIWRGSLPALI